MQASPNVYCILRWLCFAKGLPKYAFIKPSLNVTISPTYRTLPLIKSLKQQKGIYSYICNRMFSALRYVVSFTTAAVSATGRSLVQRSPKDRERERERVCH
jgi:hypothetical protein